MSSTSDPTPMSWIRPRGAKITRVMLHPNVRVEHLERANNPPVIPRLANAGWGCVVPTC